MHIIYTVHFRVSLVYRKWAWNIRLWRIGRANKRRAGRLNSDRYWWSADDKSSETLDYRSGDCVLAAIQFLILTSVYCCPTTENKTWPFQHLSENVVFSLFCLISLAKHTYFCVASTKALSITYSEEDCRHSYCQQGGEESIGNCWESEHVFVVHVLFSMHVYCINLTKIRAKRSPLFYTV